MQFKKLKRKFEEHVARYSSDRWEKKLDARVQPIPKQTFLLSLIMDLENFRNFIKNKCNLIKN